ncbi:hypothetical protein, partial [Collinsella aerofaciens]|uniref:hypothetical protein n=1 Tax=Collinsella aerofaciens TaxID=74426 RepID=UPI0034A30137
AYTTCLTDKSTVYRTISTTHPYILVALPKMSYVVINEMTTLSFHNAFLKQEGFRAVLTIHRRPVPSTCIAHQVAKELYGRHRKDARKASTVL